MLRALTSLPVALGGLIPALTAQVLVYLALPYIHHLGTLLAAVYASLFASLGLLPVGAALMARLGGVRIPPPGLRPLLVILAAALSALWYRLLNPFPLEPLLANGQYLPALGVAGVMALAWLFFLFILKRVL